MPSRKQILNKKLYIATLLLFVFYLIIAISAIFYTYDNLQRYGLYYSDVIMTQFTSDFFANLSIVIIMAITSLVFLFCSSQNVLIMDFDPAEESSSYGITFPEGKPTRWDISANVETQQLEVRLNNDFVCVTKETIENLFKGEIRKQ